MNSVVPKTAAPTNPPPASSIKQEKVMDPWALRCRGSLESQQWRARGNLEWNLPSEDRKSILQG